MKTKHVRDWKGDLQPAPQVKGKLCKEHADLQVRLVQQGIDRFAVIYGLQVKERMNYGDAASEYGACLMHALACDGKLDNRSKGER